MIFGIGTDLVEAERIQRAMQRKRFLEYVYTEKEQKLIAGRVQQAAGNFAVKEAVVKAFGTGFAGIHPKEIEVLRDKKGKPYVCCYGAAESFVRKQRIEKIHVSISNLKEYAQAFAVAECQAEDMLDAAKICPYNNGAIHRDYDRKGEGKNDEK